MEKKREKGMASRIINTEMNVRRKAQMPGSSPIVAILVVGMVDQREG